MAIQQKRLDTQEDYDKGNPSISITVYTSNWPITAYHIYSSSSTARNPETGPTQGCKFKMLTLCRWRGNLCTSEWRWTGQPPQDPGIFWGMLWPQNKYLKDGNIPNKDWRRCGEPNVTKLPKQNLQIPWEISWPPLAHHEIDVQPLIDKIGARLPGWKGRLMSTAGRETLVKTVLSSQPIYHMTIFEENKWLIKKIDSLRRSFLWRGETPNKVYGGHSIINWSMTCRPKDKGGLGILDLDRFARALRLRWLWYQWKHRERP